MKTIYLFRHSIPTENKDRLTEEGIDLARKSKELVTTGISKVYSSTLARAYETAKLLTDSKIITDEDLIERVIGNREEFSKEMWVHQYEDSSFADIGGESFDVVRRRLTCAINRILKDMAEDDSVIVVSHATAISAYLHKYCIVKVIDIESKSRRVVFNGQVIMEGKIQYASFFKLVYDNDKVVDISYHSLKR